MHFSLQFVHFQEYAASGNLISRGLYPLSLLNDWNAAIKSRITITKFPLFFSPFTSCHR